MNSKRMCWLLLVGVSLVLSALVVTPPAAAQNDASVASTQTRAMIHYSLPPDKLQKSYALYLIGGLLYFVTTAWGLLVLYAMLRVRFGACLRDLAVRA